MSGFPFYFSSFREVEKKELTLEKIKYHYEEPYLALKMGRKLAYYLSELDRENKKQPIALCIGTDRSTGDSLGPLVGTKLESLNTSLKVFGTLNKPVHATNLEETISEIQEFYPVPLIIAIDACLGRSESIGHINLSPGPLKPGAGVNKTLPQVGDIHFTGIVNVSGYMEYFVLQNTRLSLVWNMADLITASINYGFLLRKASLQKTYANSLQ